MLFARPVLEIFTMGDVKICLSDYPGDGNSENENSENSEEDTEIYSLENLEIPQVLIKLCNQASFEYWLKQEHFMGIPNPPPEEI